MILKYSTHQADFSKVKWRLIQYLIVISVIQAGSSTNTTSITNIVADQTSTPEQKFNLSDISTSALESVTSNSGVGQTNSEQSTTVWKTTEDTTIPAVATADSPQSTSALTTSQQSTNALTTSIHTNAVTSEKTETMGASTIATTADTKTTLSKTATISETTRNMEIASTSATLVDNRTATGEGSSETNTNNILIGCLVSLSIVVVLFLSVLYYYCNNKQLRCLSFTSIDGENIPLDDTIMATRITTRRSMYGKNKFVVGQMLIKAEDFESEFIKKSADDNRHFRMEFLSIEAVALEKQAANHPANKIKNRYDNVLPYDATRVRLNPIDDVATSDYINANFVSGYLTENKWIACQGPKQETINHFWQMVWEQNSLVIIMLTNLVEQQTKVKCEQYWPKIDKTGCTGSNLGKAKYGDFSVSLTNVNKRGFYVVRTLQLALSTESPRIINQFHYVAWPDFGVPSNSAQLLQFRRRVEDKIPPHAGPTIVHCSAGVGRTGTYILIDAALNQLYSEGKADLFSFLSRIRLQRMMLVQTDAQYAFAHKAVSESIKYGMSEVNIVEFKKKVQDLRKKNGDSEETELEVEFQKLLKIPLAKDCLKHGRKSLKKNRVLQIMPYDFNRVSLPRKPGFDRSDYINASYIDGFYKKKTFIATQGPLKETTEDFWTMVWQNNVKNIVMLSRLEEKGQATCQQYWPEKGEKMLCNDFIILLETVEDDDIGNYMTRVFRVFNNQQPGEEKRIQQFHYKGWPDIGSGTPNDAYGLIDIFQKLKITAETCEPIIIHCSSGGGRTGVFCALGILIGQSECENVVDVFQTVRYLREQRPHMIQTQDQFYFCYASLLQYLEANQLNTLDVDFTITPHHKIDEAAGLSPVKVNTESNVGNLSCTTDNNLEGGSTLSAPDGIKSI